MSFRVVTSKGAGREERRARTASACRGPASSRPFPGAPYVDTRFVYAPTPVIVPQLDFTRLNTNAAGNFTVAPYYEGEPRPRKASVAAGRSRRVNDSHGARLHGGSSRRRIEPAGWEKRSPDNKRATAQAAAPFGSTDISAGGQQLPKQRKTVMTASIQEPGLTHPKPPDVPVPITAKQAREGNGPESESLSARLARLAAVGDATKVVPLELV